MSLLNKKIKTELAKTLYKESITLSGIAQIKTGMTGTYIDIAHIEKLFGINIFGKEEQ